MKTSEWTIDRVKTELPDIKLQAGGEVRKARISGRFNLFATVYVDGWKMEFSWDAITRALNSDSPIVG